jgi:hypothetical protein
VSNSDKVVSSIRSVVGEFKSISHTCDTFGMKEGTTSHIVFSCKTLTHTDIT